MRQFNPPAAVDRSVTKIENFKGVDLTNSPTNVSPGRSPEAPNMIRDVPGKVRKRMGYKLDVKYDDEIYGVFHLTAKGLYIREQSCITEKQLFTVI